MVEPPSVARYTWLRDTGWLP
ncbi:hypothetical protein A5827_000902 [Enterococcus faecium]|nr:hypothetical protein A5827_000902 [Enterococcus faecium]